MPAPTARGPQAAGGTAGRSPPSHRPSAPASSRYLPEDTETPQTHLDRLTDGRGQRHQGQHQQLPGAALCSQQPQASLQAWGRAA